MRDVKCSQGFIADTAGAAEPLIIIAVVRMIWSRNRRSIEQQLVLVLYLLIRVKLQHPNEYWWIFMLSFDKANLFISLI